MYSASTDGGSADDVYNDARAAGTVSAAPHTVTP